LIAKSLFCDDSLRRQLNFSNTIASVAVVGTAN
jgi:hypothetical protein